LFVCFVAVILLIKKVGRKGKVGKGKGVGGWEKEKNNLLTASKLIYK
jgi:hypothetical protein